MATTELSTEDKILLAASKVFTEKGFYNSLNPLTGDWDILECKDYFFNKEICQHINLLRFYDTH